MKRVLKLTTFPLLLLLLIACRDTTSTDAPTVVVVPEVLEAIETLDPVLTAVPEAITIE